MQPENINKNMVCRLCLNIVSYTNSDVIEKVTKEVLDVVLPNLTLEVLICKACCTKLFSALNFKLKCMDTEDIISSYINFSKVSLVDLKEIYLKVNGNIHDTWENQRICRLCLQLITYKFVSVNEVDNDIIEAYIPQSKINVTKNPVICRSCFDSLCTHGGFVKTCLEAQLKYNNKQGFIKTEETEIKLDYSLDAQKNDKNIDAPYIKFEDIDMKSEERGEDNETSSHNSDEKTNENKMKETSKDIGETKYEDILDPLFSHDGFGGCFESPKIFKIADKKHYTITEQNEIKMEDDYDVLDYENIDIPSYIKSEEIEIKPEELDHDNDPSYGLVETIENRNMQISENTGQTTYEHILKCETEVQINKCKILLDGSTYTNRYKRKFEAGLNHKFVPKLKNTSEIHMYNCHTCPYKTKSKGHLRYHQLTHKNPSEVEMYKCDTCSFETKFKHNLKSHQVIHKNASEIQMYLCDECCYETKRKNDLKNHQLTHKDPSKVQMYMCDTCNFETKYKRYMKYHQLTHKDPSQFEIYKCDECDYESKHKIELKSHQLMHKNPSEVHMYKCDTCSFKTKFKYYLKMHQIVHKDSSETQLYKCDQCDYETKRRSDLKNHQLSHKDPSEIQIYRCYMCNFETKFKNYLKMHLITHKKSCEIQMYKCDTCTYETKYKGHLKTHQLIHKDPSETQMYKCDACSYETKHKRHLKTHQLIHKDSSEVQMYKCDVCTYESKYKKHVKDHQLIHKNPSELEMYKCNACHYESKCKGGLKRHQLTHKGPSEIQMYKCDACDYETKHKGVLKSHQIMHKNT